MAGGAIPTDTKTLALAAGARANAPARTAAPTEYLIARMTFIGFPCPAASFACPFLPGINELRGGKGRELTGFYAFLMSSVGLDTIYSKSLRSGKPCQDEE